MPNKVHVCIYHWEHSPGITIHTTRKSALEVVALRALELIKDGAIWNEESLQMIKELLAKEDYEELMKEWEFLVGDESFEIYEDEVFE